jgi:hypothetical protein
MKLHKEVLGKDGMALFPRLCAVIGKAYLLAGGTALALQAGHRRSDDLDFMGYEPSLSLAYRERLKKALTRAGRYRVLSEDAGTLHMAFGDIRVSVLAYGAPFLRKPVIAGGGRLTDPVDIGLMKLSAIVGRGSKKDFIDLACIIRNYSSLKELLALARIKYPESPGFPMLALKALSYYRDAEREPDPLILLEEYRWDAVKRFMSGEVSRIAARYR